MQHDPLPTITLTETHAIVQYPRRRGKNVSEILGRVAGVDGEPDRVYLRTRLHVEDNAPFADVHGGRWIATGAISTVLSAPSQERYSSVP